MKDSHGHCSRGVDIILGEMNKYEIIIQLVSVVKRIK